MTRNDVAEFGTRILALAEVYDRKPPTEAAVRIWCEALRYFPAFEVFNALDAWGKTAAKFPVPADITRVLNERATTKRERDNVQEKVEFRQPPHVVTPHAERCLAQIMARLKTSSTHHPRQSAFDILEALLCGENFKGRSLSEVQINAACEAVGVTSKWIASMIAENRGAEAMAVCKRAIPINQD